MTKKMMFDVSDFEITEHSNKQFLSLRLYAIATGKNRNGSNFSKESIESAIPTVFNKPVLARWNDAIGDTEEHNGDLALDDEGELYWDYSGNDAQKSVGTIPESAKVTIENHDGKDWLTIDNALIWVGYNHKLTKLITRQKRKKISVEVDVLESEVLNGVEFIKKFVFDGVTILGKTPEGKLIREGIEGAHLSLKEVAESVGFAKFREKVAFALSDDKSPILSKYLEGEKKVMSMSMNEIQKSINGQLNENGRPNTFYIVDMLPDENIVIVENWDDGKILAIPYTNDGEKVAINIQDAKEAHIKYQYISKEEWGKGPSLQVDKKKESVSFDSWGKVSKSELRNSVLKAKNYKTLVDSVYLDVEDGWEDSPSSNLKYPVMQLKDGKFVYNAGGLLSAQQYGEANDKSVADKAKSIRKKLGLLESEKREKMKAFIEKAKEAGFVYLGKLEDKLAFAKMGCADTDEVEVRLFSEEKANGEEFATEESEKAAIKMCDDDGKKPDAFTAEEKEELEKKVTEAEAAKTTAEAERDTLKEKLSAIEADVEKKEFDELVKKTDLLLEKFKESIDEKDSKELLDMRAEKKFKSFEEFSRELSYRKFSKELQESEEPDSSKRLSFGLDAGKNRPDAKDGLDSI